MMTETDRQVDRLQFQVKELERMVERRFGDQAGSIQELKESRSIAKDRDADFEARISNLEQCNPHTPGGVSPTPEDDS